MYLQKEPDNSVELQLALLAQMVNNALGGKMKFKEALITRKYDKSYNSEPTSAETIKNVFSVFGTADNML